MSQTQAVDQTQDDPANSSLKPGATLLRGQYSIKNYLASGGFGITYLAQDSLERDVVVKECYPGALCIRNGDVVEPQDPSFAEDLKSIVDLFILEARNHARLVHPNIVNVHQVFEDNDTAYIAMDLIKGGDLLEYVQNPNNDITPDFIVRLTEKMLSAVAFIHESGMLHRDISPDNILINENGEPILIDFGAAREQAANKSSALLALRVVKDGYSPHEFYVRGSEQGPSSDLYVLAATLYHAISGQRPADGQTRLNAVNAGKADPYVPLAGKYENFPEGYLEALDKAMEVHSVDRPQSVLEWLRLFRGPRVEFEKFGYRPVSAIVALDREEQGLSPEEQERIARETEGAHAVVAELLASEQRSVAGADDAEGEASLSGAPIDTVVHAKSGGAGKGIAIAAAAVVLLGVGGYVALSGGVDDVATQEVVSNSTETEDMPEVSDVIAEEVEVVASEEAATSEESAAIAPQGDASVASVEAEGEIAQPLEETAQEPEVAEPIIVEPADEVPEQAEAPVVESVEEAEVADTPPTRTEPFVPKAEQVSFAHWDVDVPFQTSTRKQSNVNIVAITGVDPNANLEVVGNWITRGALIYTINGDPIPSGRSFASSILRDMSVDPDGYTRFAVRYRPMGKTRALNGLVAIPAVRTIGLENGVVMTARTQGVSGWQMKVREVGNVDTGTLRAGDIVLREIVTGQSIDAPERFDAILEELVASKQSEAKFEILRNGAELRAVMTLAE